MKTLQRSNQLNGTVKYWSDATGRDSYIVNNNGGFFVKNPSNQAQQIFTINRKTRNYSQKAHYVEKQVHYVPDGTGKDTYIKCNDGGQFQNQGDKDIKKFYQSLRGYEKLYSWTQRKPDYFQQCQNNLSKKEQIKNKQLGTLQSQLNKKLSLPKANLVIKQ